MGHRRDHLRPGCRALPRRGTGRGRRQQRFAPPSTVARLDPPPSPGTGRDPHARQGCADGPQLTLRPHYAPTRLDAFARRQNREAHLRKKGTAHRGTSRLCHGRSAAATIFAAYRRSGAVSSNSHTGMDRSAGSVVAVDRSSLLRYAPAAHDMPRFQRGSPLSHARRRAARDRRCRVRAAPVETRGPFDCGSAPRLVCSLRSSHSPLE